MFNTFNQTAENTAEQCAELRKAALDQWVKLNQISIENAERIANVNINAAKEALDEQVKQLQNIPNSKDAQGWASWRQRATEDQLESFFGYARRIYEATANAQTEVGKVLQDGIQQYQKHVTQWADQATKSAPAGSELAINAIKHGIDATNAAIEGINKATRQAAELAETSVKAAVNASINTARTAQQHAAQALNTTTAAAQQHAGQAVQHAAATPASTSGQQHNKKAAN